LTSDEGEIPPPPPKKPRVSSEKTATTESKDPVKEGLVPPEGAPIVPPSLKRTLKKMGTLSIATTPATSASRDHESAIAVSVFVVIILTRVAPKRMLGCLQPSVGLMDVRVFSALF
jgi:hypothetical protein